MQSIEAKAQHLISEEKTDQVDPRRTALITGRLHSIYRHVLRQTDADGRLTPIARQTRRLIRLCLSTGCSDPRIRRAIELRYHRYFEWIVNFRIARRFPSLLMLHSAGVAFGEGCILLAGASATGKTTLTGHLVRGGADYLSDELIGLDFDTGHAHSFPKALSLKERSYEMFRDVPFCAFSKALQPVRYIDPEDLGGGAVVEAPLPVIAIVFPEYAENAKNRIDHLTRGETITGLIGHASNLKRQSERGLALLTETAKQAPGYRIGFTDTAFACEEIVKLATAPVG